MSRAPQFEISAAPNPNGHDHACPCESCMLGGHTSAGFDLGFRVPFVSDAVDTVANAVVHNPVSEAIGHAIGDFANTAIGKVVIDAFTGGAFGALATVVGPTLAGAVFALPGIAQGDDFAKAWVKGFADRVALTAQILGPKVGELVGDTIKPATDAIMKELGAIGNVPVSLGGLNLVSQVPLPPGMTIEDLAKRAGVERPDVAAWGLSAAKRILPPANAIFDAISGRVTVPTSSPASVALGIPVVAANAPKPATPSVPTLLGIANQYVDRYGKLTLSVNETDSLNKLLYGMKADKAATIVAPASIVKWLGDHGIAASRMRALAPPLSVPQAVNAALGQLNQATQAIPTSTGAVGAMNDLLLAMKSDKATAITVPLSMIAWLRAHGIAANRMTASKPPPSATELVAALAAMVDPATGKVPLTPAVQDLQNTLTNVMKADKTIVVQNTPPAVAAFLGSHGIAPDRILAAAPPAPPPSLPSAALGPDLMPVLAPPPPLPMSAPPRALRLPGNLPEWVAYYLSAA